MTDINVIYAVILSTATILLLVAGIVITVFISSRQRLRQDARMAQMQAGYEKELRTVAHEVQEQALANVAAELHDNIGQILTAMHLQMEERRLSMPALAAPLQPIAETLADAIQQVRLLSRNLNSDLLEQNGLLQTMSNEVDRLLRLNHFTIHWNHDNTEPELSRDQRLMAFRIFQEALNNAMKHSAARNIHIALDGAGRFRLQLRDDGVGFDMATVRAGAGLNNMARRAAMAHLSLSIDAQAGQGSTFTLQHQKE